jgi:hypothetical protein
MLRLPVGPKLIAWPTELWLVTAPDDDPAPWELRRVVKVA